MKPCTFTLLLAIGLLVTGVPEAPAQDDAGAEFASGSVLNTDRQGAFAARLADGRIAVFGGHGDGFDALGTAEVSTAPGAWTQLTMNAERDLGAGCVLADGRVLLAGGSLDGGNVPGLASAEIFDPATDAFNVTGSMSRTRGGCGAVLLDTDDVLIVGSWFDAPGAAVAELYDAGTGTFSTTGSLSSPRAYPLLVPCQGGKALVIGGSPPTGGSAVQTIELYDQAAGTFTDVRTGLFPGETDWTPFSQSETRHDPAFHRLSDGRYLHLAYRASAGTTEYVLFTVDPATRAIERFATSTPLPNANASGGWLAGPLVSLDGSEAYVIQMATTTSLRLLRIDVATGDLAIPSGSWAVPNDHSIALAALAVMGDGRLLLAGGRAASGGANSASVDATLVISTEPPDAGGTFEVGAPLNVDRQGAFAARFADGRVAVVGGHGDGFVSLGSMELSSPPGAWSLQALHAPFDLGPACMLRDGRLFFAGGAKNLGVVPGYADAQIYDPVLDGLSAVTSMPRARTGAAAAHLTGGDVLVAGSWFDNAGAAVSERYEVGTDTWTTGGQLITPRAYPLLLPLDGDRALMLGGRPPMGGSTVASVELYDRGTDTFTVASSELIAGDAGWRPYGQSETQHDIAFHENGMGWTLLAHRPSGAQTEFTLFEVDRIDGSIHRFDTTPAIPNATSTGGWLIGPVTSLDYSTAYIVQMVTSTDLRLLHVNLTTGELTIPSGTWSVPAGYTPSLTGLAVLDDGRILLAGGRESPGNANFTSSPVTILITPEVDVPITEPPAAPENVALVPLWSDHIRLTWDDVSDTESGFRVERREIARKKKKQLDFAPLATVDPGVTRYDDRGTDAQTRYEYRVCSFNDLGDSDWMTTEVIGSPGGKLSVSPRAMNFGKTPIGVPKPKTMKIKNKDRKFPAIVDIRLPPNIPFRIVEGGGLIVLEPRTQHEVKFEYVPTEPGKTKEKVGLENSRKSLKELLLKLKGKTKK